MRKCVLSTLTPMKSLEILLSQEGLGEWRKRIPLLYSQSHRFYHNMEHILSLVKDINQLLLNDKIDDQEWRDLMIIAAFHDIVYDPKNAGATVDTREWGKIGLNEYRSIAVFLDAIRIQDEDEEIEVELIGEELVPYVSDDFQIGPEGAYEHEELSSFISAIDYFDVHRISVICEAIAATSRRIQSSEKVANIFWTLDNQILESSFEDLLIYEQKIFKEFQYASVKDYKVGRYNFLINEAEDHVNLKYLAEFVKHQKPRVGVYPGSFNPFHRGHLNILEKAERLFDKVIIVKAVNPEKPATEWNDIPDKISNREIIEWSGLTPDLLRELSNDAEVTLVRGLRNGKDLDYEVNQLRFMESMYPEMKVCYIPCDKEYEHISSSAIRNISKFPGADLSIYKV